MVYRAIQDFDFANLARLYPSSRTNPAALGFFSRTGYSFLAHLGGAIQGFVLAQPIWQGDRTVVWIAEMAAASPLAYRGLLSQVLKTAYQTGAFAIYWMHHSQDADLNQVLREMGFSIGPMQFSVRLLEARATRGETEGLLE